MANQIILAERFGRQLIPGLEGDAASRFGIWAMNYIRDHPDDARAIVDASTRWIQQNLPEYASRAWHMTNNMADRVTRYIEDSLPDLTGQQNQFGRFFGESFAEQRERQARERREVAIDSRGEIPEPDNIINSAMENTSGRTRPADGPPEGEPEAQLARMGGGTGPGNPVSKETPISIYPTLTYGLQETHTTILPWTGYFSIVGSDLSTPTVQEIRLTQPHDILITQPAAPPTGATAGWTKGIFSKKFNDSSKCTDGASVSTTASFPSTAPPGPYLGERAAWFTYWAKLYEYYTVLGCEYEIHVNNPNTTNGTGVVMGWDYNAYSDTAGATGNKTPQDQPYHTMQQYKGIHWVNITDSSVNKQAETGGTNYQVVRGKYKPGMAHRNIQNDGDVKTWIATGAPTASSPAAPTLKELLTLYFYAHPWNHVPQTVGTSNTNGVNVMVTVKFIVQFKDLYITARYPNNTTTNIALTIEDDVIAVA